MPMPMPGDLVTNERSETVLLGIATQIVSGMAEVKPEMSGLINEAEFRWQARLDEQRSEPGAAGTHPDGAAIRQPKSSRNAKRLSRAHCVRRMPS